MNISAPFIDRPVATTLLTLGVALAGAIAFRLLPVSPLPQVDFPIVSVQANMPGASPETMSSSVATPLERHLGAIAGVTEMTSRSTLGNTVVCGTRSGCPGSGCTLTFTYISGRADQLLGDNAQDVIARFRREAQAAGRLTHANIVSIYEFGEDKVATPEGKPKFMDLTTAMASVDFLLSQSTGREAVHITFFGGETLHYFALALTIGICFGIYSSVLVMAPLVMWMGVSREDLVKPEKKAGFGGEKILP